ncbi:MAG: Coagulation factor 5/8 type domain-containing protein, partial [Solirubrobacterales bacterium]
MRRRLEGASIGLAAVALLALLSLCPAGATAQAPSRYAFADTCQTLQAGAGAVTRLGLGYAVGGGAGQPFFMKASGLGSYLLQGADGKFLATGSIGPLGNATLAAAQPGPAADWALREAGEGLTLSNVATGRALALAGDGRLIQTSGQGAVFVPRAADGCASFPEIGLEASGTPWTGPTPYGEVVGTIDGHNHVTAYEFLGGDAHCGEPWSRYGVEAALVDCPDHYPNGAA